MNAKTAIKTALLVNTILKSVQAVKMSINCLTIKPARKLNAKKENS